MGSVQVKSQIQSADEQYVCSGKLKFLEDTSTAICSFLRSSLKQVTRKHLPNDNQELISTATEVIVN